MKRHMLEGEVGNTTQHSSRCRNRGEGGRSRQLLLQRLRTEATFSQSSRTWEGLSEHRSAQDTGAGPQAFPASPGAASLCRTSETALRVLWPRQIAMAAL